MYQYARLVRALGCNHQLLRMVWTASVKIQVGTTNLALVHVRHMSFVAVIVRHHVAVLVLHPFKKTVRIVSFILDYL